MGSESEDPELQAQFEEALRRSREETNREESQLAEALAASLTTRDEELARSMQQEQIFLLEQTLRDQNPPNTASTHLSPSANSSPQSWQTVPNAYEPPSTPPRQPEGPSSPSRSRYKTPSPTPSPERRAAHRQSPSRGRPFRGRGRGCRRGRGWRGRGAFAFGRGQELPSPSQYVGGTYADVAAAMPSPSSPGRSVPIMESGDVQVVIDGQNVGCAFGGGDKPNFKAKGVFLVLEYYRQNGVKAVAVLPRHKVDIRRHVGNGVRNNFVADDPALLLRLEHEGRVAFTPAGAHDDYFVLQYAMRKGADVISNDRFQKELEMQETADDVWNLRTFLDEHLIPFAFVADEFVPNPKPSQLGRSLHQSRAKR